MDSIPNTVEEPGSSRSSVLDDFATIRGAAVGNEARPSLGADLEPRKGTGPPLGLGAVAGLFVFTVGAMFAMAGAIGAIGALVAVLGLALAIASTLGILRRRRVGTIGGLGLAGGLGWVLLVVGFALGVRSYDERFIYDNRSAFWEIVSSSGALMAVLGLLLVAISIVGIVLVALVRLFRRAPSSA